MLRRGWGALFLGLVTALSAFGREGAGLEWRPEGWTRVQRAESKREAGSGPQRRESIYRLNEAGVRAFLQNVRVAGPDRTGQAGVDWAVPTPDGEFKRFLLTESSVMAPELAAKYPGIQTFEGVGLEDSAERIRLSSWRGQLHAQVRTRDAWIYIDPDDEETSTYVAYYAGMAAQGADVGFECLSTEEMISAPLAASTEGTSSNAMRRVYRLAVAATGEYTQFYGGTVEAALAAIVTAVNRLNGIYEPELAIRFELVAENDRLIFTNPATDPYSNSDAAAMILENQWTVDSFIGSANYDLGHVFATGGGGLAKLDSACVTGWKARAVTGRPDPTVDSFLVDYVAHEMGHQFGARHSFNGVTGNCSAENRHAGTAYEPGSGSTIMSYSGLCGSDNLLYDSDPYFHSANLVEIRNFIAGAGPLAVDTGNTIPSVSAGMDFCVPAGTPFELTAAGEDPDGDELTYCWEQVDLGPAAPLDGQDHGEGPLFRSYPPTETPVRVFPRLANLLRNSPSPAEVLPTTARVLNFRVTVRDNRVGGGAVAMDALQLTVVPGAGPFQVMAPNGLQELSGQQTVTWDVADTDNSPIACGSVDILLSTNGGYDYPITLAEGVPNNGAAVITLPDLYCTTSRIKVRGNGHVFFDVSDADFTVTPSEGSFMAVVFETNTFLNSTGCRIPASGTQGSAVLFPSEILVSNVPGMVDGLEVQLHDVSHSYLEDLDLLLVGPSGQSAVVMSDAGAGSLANGVDLAFSDVGEAVPEGVAVPSGVYRPVNLGAGDDGFPVAGPHGTSFSVFNGSDPNGVWSLYIIDDATGDSGMLEGGWTLSVRTSRVEALVAPAPVITSLRVTEGQARLEWTAVPDQRYRVECRDGLGGSPWQDVGIEVTATDQTATATWAAKGVGSCFFRVVLAP